MSQYLLYTYGASPLMYLSKVEPTESIDKVRITDVWSYPDARAIESSSFTYPPTLRNFHVLAKFDYQISLDEAKQLHPQFFI